MPPRRRLPAPPDLNATLELVAARIGDRIGEEIARALGRAAPAEPAPPERKRCETEGCDKPAAAKGLCKSHYNLMLYHRRKAEEAPAGRRAKRPAGRRPRSAR